MRTIRIKLSFLWNDEPDTIELEITVPDNISDEKVYATIVNTHSWLCIEDPNNVYDVLGRTPETLINYVCTHNGWTWRQTPLDFEIRLY